MSEKGQDFRLILASGSPRRRELLTRMGYDFEIIVPDVDEDVAGPADEVVSILAERKARAVADRLKDGIVIASDTLVALDNRVLGKPVDEADAKRMLQMLSDRMNTVYTGVAVTDAASGRLIKQVVRTDIIFREISDAEIDAYIATGEPMDKAGAYGIQGGAGKFLKEMHGTLENAMGFPVIEIGEMLEAMGARLRPQTEE